MNSRKEKLLQRHRRQKRLVLWVTLVLLTPFAILVSWWLIPLVLFLGWVAHEAWFADHIFYSARDDYMYRFSPETAAQAVTLADGRLRLSEPLAPGETLILALEVRSTRLGHFLDPHVWIGDDRQDFERGARGLRYLNLSGQAVAVGMSELPIEGRFCDLATTGILYTVANPDYAQRRLMVLAPHADDAELAAFGLYHRASDVVIVTVTQGEVDAERYQRFGLDAAQAAQLKGRLRVWDSQAIPLWGGVPQSRCVQLGYYCLQLASMLAEPELPVGSRESGARDVRKARRHNPLRLPADEDGVACGKNFVADLAALLEHFRPEVVLTPHPELDPHPDHFATSLAIDQAAQLSSWKPEIALLYSNHLYDNDRWPMGPAGNGVALPPTLAPLPADGLWSLSLTSEEQLDKAMALAMHHDLQDRLPVKQRARRMIQRVLAGRHWPRTGENEFFRKAVRRHELFWVRRFDA